MNQFERMWIEAVRAAALSESLGNVVDAMNNSADGPTMKDWTTGVQGRAEALYEVMLNGRPTAISETTVGGSGDSLGMRPAESTGGV